MLAAAYFRVFDVYELQSYDWRCMLRGPRPVSDKVVLIDIWDDALETFGAWPFNRGFHAELIKTLHKYGVKAVAFDVLFVEPREGDDSVIAAAKAADNVYFVSGFGGAKRTARKGEFAVTDVVAPSLPSYAAVARGEGHVSGTADADGKLRRVVPTFIYKNKDIEKRYDQVALAIAKKEFSIDLSKLPLDDDGYFIVSYSGTWAKSPRWNKPFTHYSYLDVLAADQQTLAGEKPRLDLSKLKDTVCFVGLTSIGSHDTKAIPIESVYPMVGMHANILNDVLMHDYIYRLNRFWNTLILALLTALIIFICRRFKPLQALGAALGVLAAYVALVTVLFVVWGVWIDMYFPFVMSIAIYAVATLAQAIMELQKREVIEKELKIASQIQQSFLPETVPTHPNFSIAVFMKPAKAVGGDLYGFLPLADEKLGVMVGDVSGKGTPAALFMAKTVSEFKFSARDKSDPSVVLSGVNDSIASESTGGLFVTMSYLVFDPKTRWMRLSNGGHLPAVYADASGQSTLLQAEEGMPIGVMPGIPFANYQQEIKSGDIFAIYSDGVSEARNRRKDEFGVEALQKVIVANRDKTSQGILDAAVAELTRFMGKADQHDDITLIIIKATTLS